ncbi:hypothetical protein GF389_06310 [Candidatus Dojkabacteria bacterium]|nr:hypothetical protein [Candidatus Dojkabacteria bacterium]
MKKKVIYDRRAWKEYSKLRRNIQAEFDSLIYELEEMGSLEEPVAKKLSNHSLFEMRVNVGTQWRSMYAYISQNDVIILSFFQKKSQKTPRRQLRKALERLKYNLE